VHCIDRPDRRGALGVLAALAAATAGCGSMPALPSLPGRSPAPAPAPAPQAVAPVQAPARLAALAPAPVPAPAPALAPAPTPPPQTAAAAARLAPLGPATVLPAAAPARNWNDFKKAAARRMVQSSPRGSFLGKVPPLLFGIPVLEIELDADGSVRDVSVLRPPANAEAADTVALAVEAIRRGGPYGDVSRLPRPWKWTEVFLFDNERRFKPRSLE
jgi:hypothetical protein